MTPGLISVVITSYNQARFLAEAVESVLSQTYRHYEVTVVDDGSEDNAAEVAARYPSVNYVWQENQDVAAARNTGLSRSRGEFQVFLDADDRFLPRAFEAGVALLKRHPDCGLVAGRHVCIDADGAPLPSAQQRPHVERDHYLELLRTNYIGCPATVMFRRSVFEAVGGFDTAINHAGDYDLYLRVAREFPILCHDEAVVEYRLHGANASRKLGMMRQYTVAALRKQLAQVSGNAPYEAACLSGIRFYEDLYDSEELAAQMRTHLRAGRWGAATRDGLALLRRHPRVFSEHARRKVQRVLAGGGGADSPRA